MITHNYSVRISYGTAKENLFDNQELSTLILISFILVKFTFDSRMIL